MPPRHVESRVPRAMFIFQAPYFAVLATQYAMPRASTPAALLRHCYAWRDDGRPPDVALR